MRVVLLKLGFGLSLNRFAKIFLVIGIIVGIISSIVFGSYAFFSMKGFLDKKIEQQLNIHIAQYETKIEEFLNQRIEIVDFFGKDEFFVDFFREYYSREYGESLNRKKLYEYLNKEKFFVSSIFEISLVDSEGNLIGSSVEEEYFNKEFYDEVFNSVGESNVRVSEVFYDKNHNDYGFLIKTEIKSTERSYGFLVAKVKIDEMIDLLEDSELHSKKFEHQEFVAVIDSNGNLFRKDEFEKVNLNQKIETLNSESCIRRVFENEFKKNGFPEVMEEEFLDFRGELVFGGNERIEETNWCLIYELSKSENYMPNLEQFFFKIVIFSLIWIFIVCLFMYNTGDYFDKEGEFRIIRKNFRRKNIFSKHEIKSVIGFAKFFGSLMVFVLLGVFVFGVYKVYIDFDSYLNSFKIAQELEKSLQDNINFVNRFLLGDLMAVYPHKKYLNDVEIILEDLEVKNKNKFDSRMIDLIYEFNVSEKNKFFHAAEVGFFDMHKKSLDEFVLKNNNHQIWMDEYYNEWGDEGKFRENLSLRVVNLLKRERILFEEFNPRVETVYENINEFREINNEVARLLRGLWIYEIDLGILKVEDNLMRERLFELRNVVSEIDALSFPKINREQTDLLNIEENIEVRFGRLAEDSTQKLNNKFSEFVKEYELEFGKKLFERTDVNFIGENVTQIFILGNIMDCQQSLRVNAEEMFEIYLKYVYDVEPKMYLSYEKHNKIIKEISSQLDRIENNLKILIGFTIIYFMITSIVFLYYFVKFKEKK